MPDCMSSLGEPMAPAGDDDLALRPDRLRAVAAADLDAGGPASFDHDAPH